MMRTVRLELARRDEFADGSAAHGYELHVSVTAAGKLDRHFWLKHRESGNFRRFYFSETMN